jgi:tellurium resistance protein TerZ
MAVSLSKGQKISLDKEAGTTLSKIVMGLGWDPIKRGGFFGFGASTPEVDLDASCILFDEAGNPLDVVWFNQLQSKDGSIVHTGDNRTGDGDGDDEQIKVDLSRIPAQVKSLVFVVNSFTGQNFSQIQNAKCRILNGANDQEIASYNLSCQGSHTGQIMAKVYRHNGEWKMHAIGENAKGANFMDLLPQIKPHL